MCVCLGVYGEPTCDELCRLRGATGSGLVVRYNRQRVVLSAVHRRDEAETLHCGRAVLVICGQGHVFLSPLNRTPVYHEIQRTAWTHLDVDHVRPGWAWKEIIRLNVCELQELNCVCACSRAYV